MRDRQPSATPSMLDRRALCTAALVLPAMAVSPARATSAGSVISAELSALIAADQAAERAFNRHQSTVYEPALASAVERTQALPHTAMTIDGIAYSTADYRAVRTARAIVAGGNRRGKAYRPWRSFAAACKRRKRSEQQIYKETGAGAAGDRLDELSDAWGDAQSAVGNHPVTTAVDLRAKLAFMVDKRMFDGADWGAELLADATRLAEMEG